MARINYYQVLGISREASDEDIKKAYRKLVFEHHPDRNPHKADAEVRIRAINAAYEIIGDPEKRGSYDRLSWGDEPHAEAVDHAVVLAEMEAQLFDEGRKELFALLIREVTRIQSELGIIRERTVRAQGYDSFLESIVLERASEIVDEFLTAEMQRRKKRLIDVATEMLLSQGVSKRGDDGAIRTLRNRLDEGFQNGRKHGIASALELFYERR